LGLNLPKLRFCNVPPTKPNISASRAQVVRGRTRLSWLIQNQRRLKWSEGKKPKVVEATWNFDPAAKSPALQFLFFVTKRDVPKSADRHKLKRWMREAVGHSSDLREVTLLARTQRKCLLLVLRIRKLPGVSVNWDIILSDVQSIGSVLKEMLLTEKPTTQLKLKEKAVA
jgi:RNase P protein component